MNRIYSLVLTPWLLALVAVVLAAHNYSWSAYNVWLAAQLGGVAVLAAACYIEVVTEEAN